MQKPQPSKTEEPKTDKPQKEEPQTEEARRQEFAANLEFIARAHKAACENDITHLLSDHVGSKMDE